MKKPTIVIALVLILSIMMAGFACAAGWYLVKHTSGAKAAIDYKPAKGSGWSVLSGPYKTKGEAARAGSIDASAIPPVKLPARPK